MSNPKFNIVSESDNCTIYTLLIEGKKYNLEIQDNKIKSICLSDIICSNAKNINKKIEFGIKVVR